jgi:hypothetical protein
MPRLSPIFTRLRSIRSLQRHTTPAKLDSRTDSPVAVMSPGGRNLHSPRLSAPCHILKGTHHGKRTARKIIVSQLGCRTPIRQHGDNQETRRPRQIASDQAVSKHSPTQILRTAEPHRSFEVAHKFPPVGEPASSGTSVAGRVLTPFGSPLR